MVLATLKIIRDSFWTVGRLFKLCEKHVAHSHRNSRCCCCCCCCCCFCCRKFVGHNSIPSSRISMKFAGNASYQPLGPFQTLQDLRKPEENQYLRDQLFRTPPPEFYRLLTFVAYAILCRKTEQEITQWALNGDTGTNLR